MKTLSAVQKPQSERLGSKLFIRYSENQLASFVEGSPLPAFTPDSFEVNSESEAPEINYSYQEIVISEKSTRDELISALINDRYTYDYQIARFANQGDGIAKHDKEFAEFQKFRAFAKEIVSAI